MKKTLVAIAALAAVGAASAQSSVTLFGVVDAAIAIGKGETTDRTRMVQGGYNSSRLGFRGVEDLGGGMSASFWLEAGLNNDDGSGQSTSANNQAAPAALAAGTQGLTFNRRSTVSLAGGFGEIRLGRDYSPQFWNITVFDPFGTNGVGTTATLNALQGPTAVRASNTIGYFLPGNLGGFYGQAQYALGENAQTAVAAVPDVEKDGNMIGVRLGYAAGPINVAVSTASTKFAAGDIKSTSVGAQFDLGVAKVMGQLVRDTVDATIESRGKGALIGALVPVGAGELRASLSTYKVDAAGVAADSKVKKLALGYVHNLSKRTALYTTLARLKNSGQGVGATSGVALNGATTTPNSSSTGFDFGVRHSF